MKEKCRRKIILEKQHRYKKQRYFRNRNKTKMLLAQLNFYLHVCFLMLCVCNYFCFRVCCAQYLLSQLDNSCLLQYL